MAFAPSAQQTAIYNALAHDNCHLVIEALAGTGKTTTILQGLRVLKPGQSAAFVAFNKSIATELQAKVPAGVTACTLHSLGFAAIRRQMGKVQVDNDKTFKLLPQGTDWSIKTAVIKLVSLCKATLINGKDYSELEDLAAQYDIELGENPTDIFELVAPTLKKSMDQPSTIDFDDMIWLPVVWGLKLQKFDVLMVDEAQDLNRAQQELVLAAGKRIVIVGDKHQAIYGFRGADVAGMERMHQMLSEYNHVFTGGVKTFPLTITRRCPKIVTNRAANIVRDFECPTDAPEGTEHIGWKELPAKGHMVLCRVNAPLIQMAYALIRENTPVKIQGRDFGKGLEALIKKLVNQDASTVALLEKVAQYKEKESAKISAANKGKYADAKLANLEDKCDCIAFLCEGIDTVREVLGRVQALFSDVEKSNGEGYVLLSSIHRAKGLEANHVHILHPELLPHPMAKQPWAIEQESNLKYVAITRSKDTLYWRA